MITKASIGIVAVAGLCFGASFLGTVVVRSGDLAPAQPPAQSPLARQLQLDPEQAEIIESHDPQFAEDLRTLREKLDQTRSLLAATFENEGVTDDEMRQRVEATIEAYNQLVRRVVEHLIIVRDHLSPEQQKRLYGLCAEKVREGGKSQRRGCGRCGQGGDGCCGRGKGRGWGRGQGLGHGRGPGPDSERGCDSAED